MADAPKLPQGPWLPIKGLVRLVEQSESAKPKPAPPAGENRYSDDEPRDDHGRWTGGGDSEDDSSGGGGGAIGGGAAAGAVGKRTFQEITADEARGDSRPVTAKQFQQLAQQGQDRLSAMMANTTGTAGLDQNWPTIKTDAFQAAQGSWGGTTIDAATGQAATSGYALTVKPPGIDTITIPEGASQDVFNTAMDTARQDFATQLAQEGGSLGVFHDDELGRIDFDPVMVVHNLQDVETIGAATHAIGGAYNFADGNGYWPPHVMPTISDAEGTFTGGDAVKALAYMRSPLGRYGLPAHRFLKPGERPTRYERRGPPRIPTNYNPAGGSPASHCGNCDMFWQGMCWGFGDVRVDPVYGKCDEWTPDTYADDSQEGS